MICIQYDNRRRPCSRGRLECMVIARYRQGYGGDLPLTDSPGLVRSPFIPYHNHRLSCVSLVSMRNSGVTIDAPISVQARCRTCREDVMARMQVHSCSRTKNGVSEETTALTASVTGRASAQVMTRIQIAAERKFILFPRPYSILFTLLLLLTHKRAQTVLVSRPDPRFLPPMVRMLHDPVNCLGDSRFDHHPG